MIYTPIQQAKTARDIARSAQKKIKHRTGMAVNLMLCPVAENIMKTPERLLQVVAISLDMSYSRYKAKSRERDIVELRFIAALFLRIHFPYMTLQQIAEFFGGQDHSSIINGLSRANNLIYTGDLRFIKKYNTALRSINLWLEHIDALAA